MQNITSDDARIIHEIRKIYRTEKPAAPIFQFVLDNAPDDLRAKLIKKDGTPSAIIAKKVVQQLTTTTVVVTPLRPCHMVIERFIEPCIAGEKFARNFVTGTWKSIARWNHLPEEARREFVKLYAQTSPDDPFEIRVAAVARAESLSAYFSTNPWLERLAELERQGDEEVSKYKDALCAHEADRGVRPRRPSKLQRELKEMRRKAARWQPRKDLSHNFARLVRLHDQMQMLSRWHGSPTGAPTKKPKSYTYDPINLCYPGADDTTHGWYALLCCLRHPNNVEQVVATGERLDRLEGIYSGCLDAGVKAFGNGLKRYHNYLGAQRAGHSSGKKEGAPQIKSESSTMHVQAISVHHGGPDDLREGLSEDGKRWEVHCDDYRPYLKIGGTRKMVGRDVAIRIPKSQYRRIMKYLALDGKISGVTISRHSHTPRVPGDPPPPRTAKHTRGRRTRRKRSDTLPKTRYFAAIEITGHHVPPAPILDSEGDRIVGIDPGSRKFLTLSDGIIFADLTQALAPFDTRRKSAQQHLSKWLDPRSPDKWRGKGYQRAKKCLTDASDTVGRMRRHLHEQIIDELLAMPYDVFALEDTAIANLTRSSAGTPELPAAHGQASSSRTRNRNLLSQGIGSFAKRLSERAKKVGKIVLLIEPAYTSRKCSRCGVLNNPGSSEIYECQSCGLVEDRDLNAARNMRDAGRKFLKTSPHPLVGGSVSERKTTREKTQA
jgi:hypothetical protein